MATFLFFISKANDASFLFILSIEMLIFWFWHIIEINEATFFFIQVWKKTDDGHLKQMKEGLRNIFFYLALIIVNGNALYKCKDQSIGGWTGRQMDGWQ